MERIAEAHQVHQLQQGVASFGVVEHSVVAAAAAATKPRAPGLPPTPPASFAGQQRGAGGDVCMDDSSGAAGRKLQAQAMPAHRRTRSDVPFAGYFPPPTHQLPQPKAEAGGWGDGGGGADDLFSSYLNLEGMDVLNSSSPDSSAKADSSENGDSEECAAWGVKRGAAAAGEPAAAGRHARSLSVDSLMGRLNFASPGGAAGMFSLEFGSAEFSPAEMKKIMADEKLAEMALADPKRVKRVLANRQSAARSKERKMRYIVELEQKVQILQTEATTLAAQLNLLQRDSATVATQNNELRFRLQAMEQQAQLRDALNDALTGEVQRLKIMTAELGVGDSCSSNGMGMAQQHNHMFQQQQQQQATPIPFYQLQHQQQQQQQQQNGTANKHESRE
ncbi:bZIP transcription factor 29-like [Hordeum vulgare subsp. vulgare]|uniref:BZIP domain-containing protein n=1 Tax=Hordeum vulgare subsp. vulgare TaxID=112509 RepID=A0A8I7BDA7_HORVV|nr:bZIP transcription factor 29-like [Hordeum vulgare subsp. vulgare]XP_044983086.1 bZIP transcription factor 29-like [Hordeum vulgare subsp. vulgare]